MPNISSTDVAIHVEQDLIHALRNPALEIPLATLGDSHIAALIILAGILNKATPRARPLRVVLPESQQQHQPIMA